MIVGMKRSRYKLTTVLVTAAVLFVMIPPMTTMMIVRMLMLVSMTNLKSP